MNDRDRGVLQITRESVILAFEEMGADVDMGRVDAVYEELERSHLSSLGVGRVAAKGDDGVGIEKGVQIRSALVHTAYHATDEHAAFETFRMSSSGDQGPGIYLADRREAAVQYGETLIQARVTLRNPYYFYPSEESLDAEVNGELLEQVLDPATHCRVLVRLSLGGREAYGFEVMDALRAQGYDGMVVVYPFGEPLLRNVTGEAVIVAFEPAQVVITHRAPSEWPGWATVAPKPGSGAHEAVLEVSPDARIAELSARLQAEEKIEARLTLAQIMDRAMAKRRLREELADKLVASAGPHRSVIFTRENGRSALAGPDASNPGGFRVTWFDTLGPSGHGEARSLREAVLRALEDGYAAMLPAAEQVHADLMPSDSFGGDGPSL
jgi:hypothetical protein